MSQPKFKRVKLPVKPFLAMSGPAIETMTHEEFRDYCGGRLATSIFKGEFGRELASCLDMAHVRGKLYYHESLLKD